MAKILLVDDDPSIVNLLNDILAEQNHKINIAYNGKDALNLFRNEEPDIVIADIDLPDKNGFELILDIIKERPQTHILAISGNGIGGRADFLSVAKMLGAEQVLSKPFTPSKLREKVNEMVAT